MKKFVKRYDSRPVFGYSCKDDSLTEQCFKDECDINNIVRKPNLGVNPFAPKIQTAQFGDFSELKTFTEAMNIVVKAQQSFEQLPSDIRRRFNDNPQEFLDFVNDPVNIDEGIRLGIYERKANVSPREAVETPQPSDNVSADSGASNSTQEASA